MAQSAEVIEARVKELIVEHLGLEPDVAATVALESFFVEDLGAESLGITMLKVAVEIEYKLEAIPPEDILKMKLVNDLVEYIKAHVGVA